MVKDKVNAYLIKLLREGTVRDPIGERLFEIYDTPHTIGMDIRDYWQKYDKKGKYFLVQWMVCTKDGPRQTRTVGEYVRSYLSYSNKRARDTAFLILKDLNRTTDEVLC